MNAVVSAPSDAPQITDNDRLGLTLFLAAVFHGIVILGVTFSIMPSSDFESAPALDVILVQTQNPSQEEDAKYLAQVTQKGGGDSEQPSRPRDLFTAPSLSKNPGMAMATSQQEQASQQRDEKIALLSQDDSDYAIKTDINRQSPEDITQQQQNQQQNNKTARLAQELSTRIEHSSQKSRAMYLTSSTREFLPASYMRQWINRVERIGNLNYPDQARRDKLSGTLILNVVINADGNLIKTDLRKSSGHQVLDDAAKRIVQLAAPYPPFPPKLRKETDIIHITRSWEFQSNNSLRTN